MRNRERFALLLPVRCILFLLIFLAGATIVGKKVGDISNWWSVIASIVNILLVAALVLLARRSGGSYRELIRYEKGRTTKKQIVKMVILVLVGGMSGMFLAGFICYGVIPYGAPMIIAPINPALAIINALILPVSTALAEDALYLGCGVNGIRNKYAAVIVPAFFFALQHCFIPTLFDVKYIIYRFLSFLPLTIVLCMDYQKKRDPVPIMVGHALIDVATAMQIIATSLIPGFYEKMCSL